MQAFRKTLVAGDPFRSWTLVWNRLSLPSETQTLKLWDDREVKLNPFYMARTANASGTMRTLILPDASVEGDARICGADGDELAVNVLPARRPKPEVWMSPDTSSAADISAALANKCRVNLRGGLHVMREAIVLPDDDAELYGYGAVMARVPNGDYGERMFIGGRNATVRGIEFQPWYLVFHSEPPVTGLVVIDCAFRSGMLGYGYTEAYFQDCVFEGCNVTFAPKGLYLRPRFLRNHAGNAFSLWGPCVGELVMIDPEFDGTDRGPVFNSNNGPITDNLIVGLSCRNIQRDDNGNEMVMCEGPNEFSRNVAIHTRVSNCDGHLFQMDAPAHDNFFGDTVMDGGGGFWLMGMNDHAQTGNIVDNFELRGGGITIGWRDLAGTVHGLKAINNQFRNGAIIGYRPSRLNQGFYNPDFYRRREPVLAYHPASGMHNLVDNVDFIGANTGDLHYANVSLEGCRVDRQSYPDVSLPVEPPVDFPTDKDGKEPPVPKDDQLATSPN